MAFEPTQPKQPDRVGTIDVRFRIRPDGEGGVEYDGRFHIEVWAADGTIVDKRAGELIQHLTPGQITAIKNFLDDIRAKAITEVLPSG